MNLESYQTYLFPIIIILFFGYRILKFKKIKAAIPKMIQNGAIIVDVRSRSEFNQASNPISKNLPLDELNSKCNELDKTKTIILCCASGTRSGIAQGILKKNGFKNVYNAGPWSNTITD